MTQEDYLKEATRFAKLSEDMVQIGALDSAIECRMQADFYRKQARSLVYKKPATPWYKRAFRFISLQFRP